MSGPWEDSDDLSQDWGLGLPRFNYDEDEDPDLIAGADEFDAHYGIDDKAIEREAERYDKEHGLE